MVSEKSKIRRKLKYEHDPGKIYSSSFSIVKREAKIQRFDSSLHALITRIVHSCGMIEVADRLSFSKNIALKGAEALRNGSTIICDCQMVASGIETVYSGEEIFASKDVPKKELIDFVESLSTDQFQSIAEVLSKAPYLNYKLKYDCSKCGHGHERELNGLADFFQ